MSTHETLNVEVDSGSHIGQRRQRFAAGSSDFSASDGESWHSPFESAGDIEDQPDQQRDSFVDLESGVIELKVHSGKIGKDCRICHMGLEEACPESGVAIELGCSCKGDLGTAHKQCAETWFKVKGNTTCEICGVTACNVTSIETNEINSSAATAPVALTGPVVFVEAQTIWQGRRMMNILLACMVLAFVISWFFHFKVLS